MPSDLHEEVVQNSDNHPSQPETGGDTNSHTLLPAALLISSTLPAALPPFKCDDGIFGVLSGET
jgi:hypothetical protein